MSKGTSPITYTPKFAYAANYSSDTLSGYSINTDTGALSSVGAAVVAGASPYSITIDPSGKFAYVTDITSGKVSVYTISTTTGGMTSVGTPVVAGSNPWSIAISGTIQ